MRRVIVLTALWLFTSTLWASDLIREARMANEIKDALLVGESVMLKDGNNDFFAIYAQETGRSAQGAVILLHGMGAHPDWVDVINPLRSQLPEHGWKTLSIQMPIAASDASGDQYQALIPEAPTRIAAAVEYLKQQEVNNIVLVAHSLGARMGAFYLAQGVPNEIKGFVAIGMSADVGTPDQGSLADLSKIKIPLLDIYGSRDIDSVLNSVAARSAAARKSENTDYRQTSVEGADHFFAGMDDALVSNVRAWIGRVAPGESIKQ